MHKEADLLITESGFSWGKLSSGMIMIDSTVNFKSLTDMLNVLTAEGFGIELFNLDVPGG